MPKTYSIVGQKHRNLDSYLVGVTPGTPATLVREPQNPYDPNAVAVWIAGQKVGYIPTKQNAALAKFIDGVGIGYSAEALIAMDASPSTGRAIDAKLIRSPNSAYPMVEV